MAVIKCKMCGGDLDISEGLSVCECEYCGTKQTVPAADNEKKLTLFARANRLRLAIEFDKAAGVYESIVADFPEEAEAYWGLVLCRYGIEYVDDPATGKKVPTCHRVSFDSVLEDTDFDQACENADALARRQYREEAKQIEDIRRGIIEVSGKEEPYDIFICYKETDENGDRTVDSVIAQDVYDALTEKGYRVFFSRISLEDKLGTEYEPYIFAALNSAKVMLAFGTDYEYYNAVWVKNEWSRFLKLMEKDKSKHLIPCYKGIDAYDMPKEFHRLQGQDMGKVGAVQDLLRGIEKILPRKEAAPQPVVQQVVQSGGPNTAALLQRGNMALEDGEWEKAKDYFDQVLNMDAHCAQAHLGMTLAANKINCVEAISSIGKLELIDSIENTPSFKRFQQFSQPAEAEVVQNMIKETRNAINEKLKRTEEKAREDRKRHEERDRIAIAEYPNRLKRTLRLGKVLSASAQATVGLMSDGAVIAVGESGSGQCSVNHWRDIVQVAAGFCHTVGLKADGTVVTAGKNHCGQCDVSRWKNIISIAAGDNVTLGLKHDGTVIAVGENNQGQCNVGNWRNITAIAAKGSHTVGLRSDGTVVAIGSNHYGECNTNTWNNIVAIAAGMNHTIGLKKDGTVIATGFNMDGQCDVSEWKHIIAIAGGNYYTVGLRANGTLAVTEPSGFSVRYNKSGECNLDKWEDIVAIAVGWSHTVGLRIDGTIVAKGDNKNGQCKVSKIKLFENLEELEKKQHEAELFEEQARLQKIKREREQHLQELTEEQKKLNSELSALKGLFSGKRRKEIEARLAEIDAELKKLQ